MERRLVGVMVNRHRTKDSGSELCALSKLYRSSSLLANAGRSVGCSYVTCVRTLQLHQMQQQQQQFGSLFELRASMFKHFYIVKTNEEMHFLSR